MYLALILALELIERLLKKSMPEPPAKGSESPRSPEGEA
jgi:hypothetical protein